MLDNHARRAAIYRESNECMRGLSWNYSDRYTHQVCKHPPPRLEPETSVFNCPTRAAELCALLDAERLIAQCYRLAKARQTTQEDHQQKVSKFNQLEKELDALRNAKKDPRRVFWDIVEPRLPTDTRIQLGLAYTRTNSELAKSRVPIEITKSGSSLFVVRLFDRNGDFSQRGSSLMQDTYDFVYARTIGDKNALMQKYNNPIINAIQGTAAEEIKRIHSSVISKIDNEIIMGIESIVAATKTPSSQLIPNHQSSSTSQPTLTPLKQHGTPTDPTCAVLDGPDRTDLSINSPEVYEQLVIKCRR